MLIDTNILVYSLNYGSSKSDVAREFIKNIVRNSNTVPVIAHQNVFEFLRVVTHKKYPNRFSITQAISALEPIKDTIKIIYPTRETQDIALALIQKYSISGSEVFDAYLVATAISNDCFEIATDNEKHLGKYQEIQVVNPFK